MNKKIMIMILACTNMLGIYAMDRVELPVPEPREIEQAPELVRVKPRVEDIVLLQALQKGYYQAASKMINARVALSAIAFEELKKPNVAEGILQAALRENHPGTINALIAMGVFTKARAQECFDQFVRNMREAGFPNSLLALLRSDAKSLINVDRPIQFVEIGGWGAERNIMRTALTLSIFCKWPDLVQALLAAGADPFLADSRGWNPLMYANRLELVYKKDILYLLQTAIQSKEQANANE